MTVGVEDEIMLVDPQTLDLVPLAPEVLAACGGDPRFKLELPASQLEIVLPPLRGAAEAAAALADARALLAERAGALARPAALALHPFAATHGVLNATERHRRIEAQYGSLARRQLLCALQVHVAVRGADRALAVHDALRAHLPALTALSAAAPFHGGRDTGHATWRPEVADLLPRHGIPPALGTWEAYAAALRPLSEPGQWWWDVRPHPVHGTLEVRVPDAQASVADAEAVIAVVHALIAWLAERYDAGEPLPVAPSDALAAQRADAARRGIDAELTDPDTGAREPARERLPALLDRLAPTAARLGGESGFSRAREIIAAGGLAERHRAIVADGGLRALVGEIAACFAPGGPG